MHGIDGMGTNHVFGRVESVEGVDNVANVEVLPVANTNTQLWNGEWVMGNANGAAAFTLAKDRCMKVVYTICFHPAVDGKIHANEKQGSQISEGI